MVCAKSCYGDKPLAKKGIFVQFITYLALSVHTRFECLFIMELNTDATCMANNNYLLAFLNQTYKRVGSILLAYSALVEIN